MWRARARAPGPGSGSSALPREPTPASEVEATSPRPSDAPLIALLVAVALLPAAGAQTLGSAGSLDTLGSDALATTSFQGDLVGDDTDDLLTTNITFLNRTAETLESAENGSVDVKATEDSDVFPTEVTYNLSGGTAEADDHDGENGTLTFTEAGQVLTIALPLVDDAIYEGDETVDLQLSSDALHVRWGTRNHTHTILEDDPADLPPSAPDDALTTDEDAAYSGHLPGSDPDGDSLSWSVATHPAHGSLELDSGTGAFTYTPDPDYAGPDAFEYRVFDGTASATGTVDVTVEPVTDGGSDDDGSSDTDGGTTEGDTSTDDTTGSDDGTTTTDGDGTANATSGSGTSPESGSSGGSGDGGSDGISPSGSDEAADLGKEDDFSAWWIVLGTVAVVACGGAIGYGYYWSQHGRF